MSVAKKEEKRVVAKVFYCLSAVAAVVLLAVGGVCWKAGGDVVSTVNKGLVAEKIFFPPAGSPAFAAEAFPDAQKYAGKQVDDGAKAKAYAEDFLGVQSKLLSGGKTLSEVSAELAMAPTPALQQLQGTMFQIETSKGLLLAGGYAGWSQGMMMQKVGAVAVLAGLVMTVVALAQFMRYKKL